MKTDNTAKKIQRALLHPFSQDDLEYRVQSSGDFNGKVWARVVAYIDNRAIQQRLDDTVGAFNWKNEFTPLPNGINGALCGISIKFDGEWITKYDGADNTQVESTKGGLSNAQKRAAVEWGIGRYLYNIEVGYADCITKEVFTKLKNDEKNQYQKGTLKNKTVFYWKPKKLDDKFLPKKHLSKNTYEIIIKLIDETDTNKDDICDSFGVDDLGDLYTDEAGKIVTMLLLKKEKLDADDKKD